MKNISRKHRLHDNTTDNFYCLDNKSSLESIAFHWDWSLYQQAEHDARNRASHRRFRKELKKGGIR